MKEFWNDRYREEEYAYGKAPNNYVRYALDKYPVTGRALFPAEGEGRNAVFAASKGLDVSAFDISKEGKNKALKLAKEKNVSIEYLVGSLQELDFASEQFDLIVLCYVHFPAELRKKFHLQLVGLLKPGGMLVLEGFSKSNLPYRKNNPKVGGPDKPELLFSIDEIVDDFSSLEPIEQKDEIVSLDEGLYHVGQGAVIRFIGRKSIGTAAK